jgi:fructose-1,6-bisphosphatase/inositol monophosphatase family enzyme
MMEKAEDLLVPIRRIHERIRDGVVEAFHRIDSDELSAIAKEAEGDTIYAVDRVGEKLLVELFEQEIARRAPIVLVSEGLEQGGQVVLPAGKTESDAVWRIIVDPIDGTRGVMYQKRSAWILTGVARNKGSDTNLSDIELAVQTEIPLIKQHLSDVVWAEVGKGARAERWNRLTKEKESLALRPSCAATIAHGFAMISRFFPGAREELAAIDEEIVRGALGPVQPGKAHCFEDQYICSGGQLYELMSGKDRFVADIRPLMEPVLESRGLILGICCHPYDLCTELIAREMGVIVTDEGGRPLSARLNVEDDVSWVGYANEKIRRQIEPLLQKALRDRGLLQETSGLPKASAIGRSTALQGRRPEELRGAEKRSARKSAEEGANDEETRSGSR